MAHDVLTTTLLRRKKGTKGMVTAEAKALVAANAITAAMLGLLVSDCTKLPVVMGSLSTGAVAARALFRRWQAHDPRVIMPRFPNDILSMTARQFNTKVLKPLLKHAPAEHQQLPVMPFRTVREALDDTTISLQTKPRSAEESAVRLEKPRHALLIKWDTNSNDTLATDNKYDWDDMRRAHNAFDGTEMPYETARSMARANFRSRVAVLPFQWSMAVMYIMLAFLGGVKPSEGPSSSGLVGAAQMVGSMLGGGLADAAMVRPPNPRLSRSVLMHQCLPYLCVSDMMCPHAPNDR